MDILSVLKNLLSETDARSFAPVIDLLRKNSFDVKKTIDALTPETLTPILRSFLSSYRETHGKTDDFTARPVGVTAIANIADKEIVYCLNRYLSSETAF